MGVRKIPKNYRNVTGVLSSTKNESMTAFESTLERDFYMILDFDLNVKRFIEQPLQVKYKDRDGKNHTYTPDVLVFFRDDIIPAKGMKHMLCEVKYRKDLIENWPDLKDKFKAARRYAKKRGWEFRLMTEREIRTPYLENVRFLRGYRHTDIDEEDERLVRTMMYELRETDPESLLVALSNNKWRRAELLSCLWKLVSIKEIGTDLNIPLTMRSRIWTVESVYGG